GDDLLEGRVLPGALGLGVATLVTELGELVTLGVSNGLPAAQGVARLPGRQLRRGRRSRTHRATENVAAGRSEYGVVVFCHLFSLVPRGPNSEMNEALNAPGSVEWGIELRRPHRFGERADMPDRRCNLLFVHVPDGLADIQV